MCRSLAKVELAKNKKGKEAKLWSNYKNKLVKLAYCVFVSLENRNRKQTYYLT